LFFSLPSLLVVSKFYAYHPYRLAERINQRKKGPPRNAVIRPIGNSVGAKAVRAITST
jgi:hypothetical protein